MAKYTMDDGAVVDTDLAEASWNRASTFWKEMLGGILAGARDALQQKPGQPPSMPRPQQQERLCNKLYRSRKGRYYVEWWYEGGSDRLPCASWATPEQACHWLIDNKYEPSSAKFPADLKPIVEKLIE